MGRSWPAESFTVLSAKSGLKHPTSDQRQLAPTDLNDMKLHMQTNRSKFARCDLYTNSHIPHIFHPKPWHVSLSKMLYAMERGTISGMQKAARWPDSPLQLPHSASTLWASAASGPRMVEILVEVPQKTNPSRTPVTR